MAKKLMRRAPGRAQIEAAFRFWQAMAEPPDPDPDPHVKTATSGQAGSGGDADQDGLPAHDSTTCATRKVPA